MPLIDNSERTLKEAIQNALSTSDRIDIAVGYFFFSGFSELAEQLRDKKVRILVGLEVDPTLVPEIVQQSKDSDVDLTKWQPRRETSSSMALQRNYLDALVGFINDSDIFDKDATSKVFDLFVEKIENGTLEIRKTLKDNHAKFYILLNKQEFSQNSDFLGTVFMGSSNFTYSGLIGQGELNDSTKELYKVQEYKEKFEELWSDSRSISIVDIHNKERFIEDLKPRIWKYVVPSPYEIYIRILHELFAEEDSEVIETPSKITKGIYMDLEYQIDAIKMVINRLRKFNGAILADVVGLGKSIIAAAVARNLDMKTVIIAPPHLRRQWEDYKEEFGIRGSKVFSSGKIDAVYERYHNTSQPFLLIIDEAHRFRNEDTTDYKYLHKICRSHPENKILLLTATPFNNDPKDVFALVKLFQTPGLSTIRSIDNLSVRYRELIKKYKNLRREIRKNVSQGYIDQEIDAIVLEQRRLIEPVIIRRSRLDLNTITRYKTDLEIQGIGFAEVVGPNLLEYDLGDLSALYMRTLEVLISEDEGFIGARYKPTSSDYMTPENQQIFFDQYKAEFEDIEDLRIAQTNLSKFMKRLLVMRFESSKGAFKQTLENMIAKNGIIENWWEIKGLVPIMKKGELPDPENYDEADGEQIDEFELEMESLRERGLIVIDRKLISDKFIKDVRHDTELLKKIHETWFSDKEIEDKDPKLTDLIAKVQSFIQENKDRKIVVFSVYKDTVNYLFEKLTEQGFDRVMKYTSSEGSDAYKELVKENFDASCPIERQRDDYDLLIATDALSEGFNLHRAGIVINYDIPYNPTRVIQRVGRINRINKKVFDKIYVYNSFPTSIGEEATRIKSISTLKIKLINAVIGSDTKTLTSDEELVSFFKDEFKKEESSIEQLSWDTIHREIYEQSKSNPELVEKIEQLPHRSRIKREEQEHEAVVVFGKKGQNTVFTLKSSEDEARVISVEEALPLVKANISEVGHEVDAKFLESFEFAKQKLFAKSELPALQGRRQKAVALIEALSNTLPESKAYCNDIKKIITTYDDLPEGTLKDIAQLKIDDLKETYRELQEIVPEEYINNIFNKIELSENDEELLLFAEQLT